jgi:hypothetical protein
MAGAASCFPLPTDLRTSSLCSAANSQLNPSNDSSGSVKTFTTIEHIFTALFAAELIWNLAANIFWNFVQSAWNWFDLVVVCSSVLGAFMGWDSLNVLRMLRALRVVRLIKQSANLQAKPSTPNP